MEQSWKFLSFSPGSYHSVVENLVAWQRQELQACIKVAFNENYHATSWCVMGIADCDVSLVVFSVKETLIHNQWKQCLWLVGSNDETPNFAMSMLQEIIPSFFMILRYFF